MAHSIAIISSQAFSLVNFRGPLIKAMVQNGMTVYALAPDYDEGIRQKVAGLGALPITFSLSRVGLNPFLNVRDIWSLSRLLRKLRPDITLCYFMKAVICGSAAAWIAKVPARFVFIEGLGSALSPPEEGRTYSRRILSVFIMMVCSVLLKQAKRVYFLNSDDIKFFQGKKIVRDSQIVRLDGIGLDLTWYAPAPPVLRPVTFLLAARMLRQKGILDYVSAARVVGFRHPQTRFLLVGAPDLNPDSLKKAELQRFVDEGVIEWHGFVSDVRPLLAQASVFVLPSYYREGMPRSIMEAMAMGRPVITTDWTGCRETVDEGVNGLLVPIRNPEALAAAMMRFIEEPGLIERMGINGRLIAERRFDVHRINRIIMDAMGLPLCGSLITLSEAQPKRRRHLLFVVNEDWYFVSHRLALAVAAKASGFNVSVATRVCRHGEHIRVAGIKVIPFYCSRRGYNPVSELFSIIKLIRIFRREQPDLVHNVGIKSALFGSIAARFLPSVRVLNAVMGMGWLFTSGIYWTAPARRIIGYLLGRVSRRSTMLVQNSDDAQLLRQFGVRESQLKQIRGSGVDMSLFRARQEPTGLPVVLFLSRLLWTKGFGEYITAARWCRDHGITAQFLVAGEPDFENPSTVTREQITALSDEGVFIYKGWVTDVPRMLAECHILCLPSYYGEGIPKALLEGAAAGLAIVTTDTPGCREVVRHGENGLLVPPRDADALTRALVRLIESPDLRQAMGARGRVRATEEFNLDIVIQQSLALYEDLLP